MVLKRIFRDRLKAFATALSRFYQGITCNRMLCDLNDFIMTAMVDIDSERI